MVLFVEQIEPGRIPSIFLRQDREVVRIPDTVVAVQFAYEHRPVPRQVCCMRLRIYLTILTLERI